MSGWREPANPKGTPKVAPPGAGRQMIVDESQPGVVAPGSPVTNTILRPTPLDMQNWAMKYGGSYLVGLLVDSDVRNLVKRALQQGWSWDQIPMFQQNLNETAIVKMQNKAPTTTGGGSGSRGGGGGGGGGASVAQNIAAASAAIRNEAGLMGLPVTDDEVTWLATRTVNENWSGDMLTDELTGMAKSKWGQLNPGTMNAGVDQIKAMAAQQLMAISEESAREYAQRVVSGELDQNGLQSLFQAQASQYYAWAAPVLGKGITMADYLKPSRDMIAQILEKQPDQVDLMDPKYMSMIQVTTDKGEIRAASMPELQRRARADDAFKDTSQARVMADQAGVYLRQMYEGRG